MADLTLTSARAQLLIAIDALFGMSFAFPPFCRCLDFCFIAVVIGFIAIIVAFVAIGVATMVVVVVISVVVVQFVFIVVGIVAVVADGDGGGDAGGGASRRGRSCGSCGCGVVLP